MFGFSLEKKRCSTTILAARMFGLAVLLVIACIGEVRALNQSENVALVPNATGLYYYGGTLPTTGFPDGYSPSFTNVDPYSIGTTQDLSGYDTVVLVGICNIGSTSFLGNPAWKSTVEQFVYNGGKLIIWDSECQNTDYSNFMLPFATNNPGQLGATGTLGVTEENSLSRTSPLSPRYVDVTKIGSQTDAVGDANVFISQDPLWCVDMRAINASIGAPARPTHTYAGTQTLQPNGFGNGLIIYNGLDKDYAYNSGFDTTNGRTNLARVWLFELLQPFNPDALPCGIPSTCGNGTIDAGEACDPASQPTGCAAGQNCDVNNCVCVTPPWCGDGQINSPEICDPARVPTGCPASLPVCNSVCTCELPTCGNDQIEGNEECDGTDDTACPGDCLPPGDVNECMCPVCGDDSVNQANEDCDGIDQSSCANGCNPPGHPAECLCVATVCDVNSDGQVDIVDIQAIFSAIRQPASGPNDPRDYDGDGVISVVDARACVLQCANPQCAP